MLMTELLITTVARAIIAEAEHLTALDQAIGDGDHGLNMKRGMEAVLAELPKLAGKPPGEVLKAVGMLLVMKVGGASGPLFGTLAMEMGKALPSEPGRADLAQAFAAAVAGVAARGKSEQGQKTMLDVLIPASQALSAGKSAAEIKVTALAAADATMPLKATRGRASFLGDRSIGHMDPGSRSSALIIATICDHVGDAA
ncbi:MAG: dihydroxyacetone kinase subunit L [Bosea sp.]|nr:dihydroxyacetone kinase subunit L [Bosea sp. (in: a-proteobacteria)]